jgi:hypothetical protein
MTLMKIRLELGRTAEFPEGNPSLGYEFNLPLTDGGHIDMAAWQECAKHCTVRRLNQGFTDRRGMIKRSGHGWQFDYDEGSDADNEPIVRLESHIFAPGNYVTLTGGDGAVRPFKIVSVAPMAPASEVGA